MDRPQYRWADRHQWEARAKLQNLKATASIVGLNAALGAGLALLIIITITRS